jgi:hypothetical protein
VRDPLATRLAARSVVVTAYVVVLAVAGSPGWLAGLLSLALVAVWAAPFVLASNRQRAAARGRPVSRPSR